MNCKIVVVSRHPRDGNPDHANSPIRFAPYCDAARVLQPATGLEACRTECLSTEPHCIRAVSVEEVVNAAREMLLIGSPLAVRLQRHLEPAHHKAGATEKATMVLQVDEDIYGEPTLRSL
jgi:hypothetical protein